MEEKNMFMTKCVEQVPQTNECKNNGNNMC